MNYFDISVEPCQFVDAPWTDASAGGAVEPLADEAQDGRVAVVRVSASGSVTVDGPGSSASLAAARRPWARRDVNFGA